MRATEDLRAEHRGILRLCGILEKVAVHTLGGEELPLDDGKGIVEFLRVFVDGCHHFKEEAHLFPAVRAADPDSGTQALIEELLAEHEEGRALAAVFAGAAQGALSPKLQELAEAASAYAALLRRHIQVEEDRLFSEADRVLPAAQQAHLEDEYERVEEEVVGPGRHEAFHAMLEDLERRYA